MDLIIYGFINSITLTLIAIGFAVAYGVSRVPNFAHGALYIFSACITWLLVHNLGSNYLVAILIALIATMIVGVLIFQLVLKRVRGMPFSEVMASFAIGMAILEVFRLAGFRGPQYSLPKFIEGVVIIYGVPVDWQRIVIVITGIILVFGIWAFTRFTRIGLGLRAIAQDEPAALMLGINIDHSATIALGIGSLLVGIAASVIIPLGAIAVETGYEVLIFALAVCIVGGLGSWLGAVIAAFVLGYAQILTVRYLAPHYQMVVAMAAIILILILKPSGLFGTQKQLEERV
ncbi:branched-chain amino acid ABC transporter permease [Desulfatiglans anilini]|uniref:branched-chain amino acid ABC transporter permease n=1 Tax=Desulfatiglans anilini TaxID=90728 RepID=UPI00048A4172|nr:branched-chain amino acid ABC transporter permease [Desulfatiglans anilini]